MQTHDGSKEAQGPALKYELSAYRKKLEEKRQQAEDEVAAQVASIEEALAAGTPLDEILALPATAAGGNGATGSSAAAAVRFLLNGDEVIPQAGFETSAATARTLASEFDDAAIDTRVDAELSVQIQDGSDELINQQEAGSVLLTGNASGSDAPAGSTIFLLLSDSSGNQISTQAIVSADGSYQQQVNLESFNNGDIVTAVAILRDDAGNELPAQDDSLLDFSNQAQISVAIDDGGDELIKFIERRAVPIIGQLSGTDVIAAATVELLISDQSGNEITLTTTINASGGFNEVVDLSGFNNGDQVTVAASNLDSAGNSIDASDTSRLDFSVEGSLTIIISDGGDELINALEAEAVVVNGVVNSDEVNVGDTVAITLVDESGNSLELSAIVGENKQYQIVVDLSSFNNGDIVTALATVIDPAGNELQAQDTSLLDFILDATITVEIQDGGDGIINAGESLAVPVSGTVAGLEVRPGDRVSLLLEDESGNQREVIAIVDGQLQYRIEVDINHFNHAEVVTATATASDPAGNTISAVDTSFIDFVYDGAITVQIADGGDELINVGDQFSVTFFGSVSGNESLSVPVRLIIQDQSGNQISTTVNLDSAGNFSFTDDLNSFNPGDLVTVTAQHQDPSGNFIAASDTSTLEVFVPLKANDDSNIFHGQTMGGNILLDVGGADTYTANTIISTLSYRGISIDLTTAQTNIAGVGTDASSFTYTIQADRSIVINNSTDLSVFTLDPSGAYTFVVGTQAVLLNEVIAYTLDNQLGATDSAILTLDVPTDNDDVITGTNLPGGDTIYALDGDDNVIGNDGDDQIFGGGGWDTIEGGDGNDIIEGSTGFDKLYGNSGEDTIKGEQGRDRLYGGSGDDNLDGGVWHDLLVGDEGEDTLFGGTGMDIILGGDDNDTIDGGRWDDSISGGSGDDFIRGGRGLDVLSGGSGNDEFYFAKADVISSSQTTQDSIYDFSLTDDVVNIADYLDGYTVGDDITDFLDIQFASINQLTANTDIDSSIEGNVRTRVNNGSVDSVIRIDVDGDGSFTGNTQEIVLIDVDLSSYGSSEADILHNLINNNILQFD